MSLKDFLYRCPACGQDPLPGARDTVACPACGLRVDREGGRDTRLRVTLPGRAPVHLLAATLADRIEALGGPLSRARQADGALAYGAAVRVRMAGSEAPVRYGGRLLGFVERFGAGTPAHLHLGDDALTLLPLGAPPGREPLRCWPLESLRALQTSSSAVQITTGHADGTGGPATGLVLFRFVEDSPRRWDELLRHAVAQRWEVLGRGPIREFQPRIRGQRAARGRRYA
jgi:hypothetical protein